MASECLKSSHDSRDAVACLFSARLVNPMVGLTWKKIPFNNQLSEFLWLCSQRAYKEPAPTAIQHPPSVPHQHQDALSVLKPNSPSKEWLFKKPVPLCTTNLSCMHEFWMMWRNSNEGIPFLPMYGVPTCAKAAKELGDLSLQPFLGAVRVSVRQRKTLLRVLGSAEAPGKWTSWTWVLCFFMFLRNIGRVMRGERLKRLQPWQAASASPGLCSCLLISGSLPTKLSLTLFI